AVMVIVVQGQMLAVGRGQHALPMKRRHVGSAIELSIEPHRETRLCRGQLEVMQGHCMLNAMVDELGVYEGAIARDARDRAEAKVLGRPDISGNDVSVGTPEHGHTL